MKILLLTDIPPCKDYTAGIVLDQLCRFVPDDALVCSCVHDPAITVQLSEDLNFPVEYHLKPRENWDFFGPVGTLSSLIMEEYNERIGLKDLSGKIIHFGRTHGVDRVWCVLQGQTMIRLATAVADGLQVPLLTQVWDPPYWWLRDNRVDPITSSRVIRTFTEAVQRSRICATASLPMAEEYHNNYGTPTIAFLPSLGREEALSPSDTPHSESELIIGIAGQIYAQEEWKALLHALDEHAWKIGGRQVRIRHVGKPIAVEEGMSDRIELCGWNTQQETIRLLSETDITYCPYWFDPRYENEARLSFPSKLTTYYASGRPVLFHGPPYAAPAQFIEKTHSGICCYSLEPEAIIKSLVDICDNPENYRGLTHNSRDAFVENLTLDILKQNFMEFVHSSDKNQHRED